MPDGMYCSDHVTPPFPPNSSSPPTTIAERHCGQRGRSTARSPRPIEKAYSTAPAIRNRTDDMRNGGMVSIASRIAR